MGRTRKCVCGAGYGSEVVSHQTSRWMIFSEPVREVPYSFLVVNEIPEDK